MRPIYAGYSALLHGYSLHSTFAAYFVVRYLKDWRGRKLELSQRLKYSFQLAIPFAALFALVVVVASADVVGILPAAAFDLVFSPFYFIVIYAISFFVSPLIESKLPFTEKMDTRSGFTNSTRNSIGFRTILITMLGLLVVFAANLLVFLIT